MPLRMSPLGASLALGFFFTLSACGPTVALCDMGCPTNSTCDQTTGLCVREVTDAGGSTRDGGSALADAGSAEFDAGPTGDAGTRADAGVQPDAGPIGDAGLPPNVDGGSCLPSLWFPDRDNDGFGTNDLSGATSACLAPAGFVASNTDCDDTTAAVSPSRAEVCDQAQLDEDCDGTRNEDCACVGLGTTRACCSGRGVETCEATDGGTSYSACSASVRSETCNGLDDDCNGRIDDLPPFVDGGSFLDAGVVGRACSVGIGACARSSQEVCQSASLFCPVDAGSPSTEICNGLDDDCNGMTDEASNLCSAVSGQTCVTGSCLCPVGQSVCGNACRTLGAQCQVGQGSCRRTGTEICSNGAVVCDAVAGQPSSEVCNGLDDNCNGSTDETGPGLCQVSGQTCVSGTCQCAAGQSVCGTQCVTLGTSCSAGVGACRRTGTTICSTGQAVCSAVAGTPSAEVCNTIDDNCNGSTDEVVPGLCSVSGQICSAGLCSCAVNEIVCGSACSAGVMCLTDADNDRYAAGSAQTRLCVDPSRPSFGGCPSGFVAPGNVLGTDCNDGDLAAFQSLNVRSDGDADGACVGSAFVECSGSQPNGGRRLANLCSPADDCVDTDPTRFRLVSSRQDSDGDQRCVGTATVTCVGVQLPLGRRDASSCVGSDDCNDSNGSLFQMLSVRADTDADGWCFGPTTTECSGSNPSSGKRLVTACSGDDCSDMNFWANAACTLAWATTSAQKNCGIGPPPTETADVSITTPIGGCPFGFLLTGVSGERTAGPLEGTCGRDPFSDTRVRMTCPPASFGSFSCRNVGTCVAF